MIRYDPYMQEIKDDPYPVYRRLRDESPVHYLERFDGWALARFEDIWQASQDTYHYTTRNSIADLDLLERKPAAIETLTSLDPPVHTAMRKQLFPFFSPRAAQALEQQIRGWTRDCIEKHRSAGRIDAVSELAQQVAVRVACSVGGFPMADADYLVDIVTRFFWREEGVDGMGELGETAREEMSDYLSMLVQGAPETPGPPRNALEMLRLQADAEGPFSLERIAQHLILILVGATETFPKSFASGLLRLWQHPDQRRQLCDDPSRSPEALTEILRYDMPTQWLGRTVARDHELHGQKLREGQPIIFLYPSGNRDEREFNAPDVFDIQRNPTRILSFGHGTHRCLGSFMARMEGQVLLEELLRHFPEYEVLEDDLILPRTEYVRGYSEFPIEF